MRILIAGVGAVGGYYGGMLAKSYENKKNVKIEFLARGENYETIKRQGISIKSPRGSFNVKPTEIHSNLHNAGVFDFIIISVKSPALFQLLEEIKLVVGDRTVIVPLLNGIQSYKIIHERFPSALVCYGCANIVARLLHPGYIEKKSSFEKLSFGLSNNNDKRLSQLYNILLAADIDVKLTANIKEVIWTKYIFISSSAACTSYLDKTFGEIQENEEYWNLFLKLVKEGIMLANLSEVDLPSDTQKQIIEMFMNAPSSGTTSLHSDLQKGNINNELEELLGYIITFSKEHNFPLPNFARLYNEIKIKWQIH